VRGAEVDDAAGQLGLVGGHVETLAEGTGVLESTARREAAEEVGLDLAGVALLYLESTFFTTDAGQGQVSVAFVAHAPPEVRPRAADAVEVADVGWWSPDEAAADPRCPPWLPDLLRRADARLDAGARG
jgi:ADP-ribose pyrophosphatase YjhB (NUDIX family)